MYKFIFIVWAAILFFSSYPTRAGEWNNLFGVCGTIVYAENEPSTSLSLRFREGIWELNIQKSLTKHSENPLSSLGEVRIQTRSGRRVFIDSNSFFYDDMRSADLQDFDLYSFIENLEEDTFEVYVEYDDFVYIFSTELALMHIEIFYSCVRKNENYISGPAPNSFHK